MISSDIYSKSPSQLIRQRYSCRTYQKRPIAAQDLMMLETFIKSHQQGPRGNQARFQILPASVSEPRTLPKLGTYGFIKNPAAFIAGTCTEDPGALEDFGYSMELLILKATELEIGSCWLGGTFTKSRFAQFLDLKPGEFIPAVTSLGYPSDHKAWIDRVSRIYAGADHRLSWEKLFFMNNWEEPLLEDKAGVFLDPLQLVRLAPSATNKQPWRLLRDGSIWHFYLERTPNYPSPTFDFFLGMADLQRIDMGIAIAHFNLGLQEAGLAGEWIYSDPHLEHPEKPQEYTISWVPIEIKIENKE